jgi:polyisoprenoid-binding protein YceI
MTRHFGWLTAAALVTAGALTASPAAADSFKIDPAHSSAQFSVTHLMISTVRGEFLTLSGTIEYDGNDVSSIKADVTIDPASITTRNEYRDKDLKSDHFFDVAKFPTLTFKSKKAVAGANGGFQLVGDLTMHGVTKEVTLDATGPSKVIKGQRGESRVAAVIPSPISAQRLINAFIRIDRWRHQRLRELPCQLAGQDGVSVLCRLADLSVDSLTVAGEADEFLRHFGSAMPRRIEALIGTTLLAGEVTREETDSIQRLRRVAVKIEGDGARGILMGLLKQ